MLDISDVRTILSMFKIKEKYTQPLSEEEMAVKHEIDAQRCVFQVDQFVKISEVRAIVHEGLAEIHKRMLKTDDVAKKASVDMQTMNTKMKNCI